MQHEDAAPKLNWTELDCRLGTALRNRSIFAAGCVANCLGQAGISPNNNSSNNNKNNSNINEIDFKTKRRPQCVRRPPLTEMRIPIHLSINEPHWEWGRQKDRERETDCNRKYAWESLALKSSVFLLLERETGHGCNCCRSPSFSHCPLPACLPGCLLWLSHCPVRLCSVIRCAAYLSKPSRITLQQRRLPFHTQWPVSSLPVPTAVSSTNPSSPTIHCQTLCLFSSFCRGRSVNCQLGVQFRLAYTFLRGLWGLLRSNLLNWNELGTEVDCYYLAYPFCIIWDCISLLTITATQSICYSYNSPLRLPTYIWTYNFSFSCMHFAHISKLVHW